MHNYTKPDEENIFSDPLAETWIKVLASVCTIIVAFTGVMLLVITRYEMCGYLASYRSVINQLMSWINLLVSTQFKISI